MNRYIEKKDKKNGNPSYVIIMMMSYFLYVEN